MKISVPGSDLETYALFLEESREHLETMELKILALGETVEPEIVNEIFRALHSMKGAACFLGLGDIQGLSHRMESVFERIRQNRLGVDEVLIRVCLSGLDRIQGMIADLSEGLEARVKADEHSWSVEVPESRSEDVFRELERLMSDPEPHAAPDEVEPPGGGEVLITAEMSAAFVKESEEILDSVEQIFLRLSETPSDAEALAEAFRGIHSFKGNAGFFGHADLEKVSHGLESMLQPIRDAASPAPKPVIEATLKALDALRRAVAGLAQGLPALIGECGALCALFSGLGPTEASDAPPDAAGQPGGDVPRLGEILIERGEATPEAVARALDTQRKSPPQTEARRDLRVDLGKLDMLLDLVGELVISTGMVFNHPLIRQSGLPEMERAAHHLKGVVAELQNVALGVRMIPVEGAFRKLTRLVHDLSAKSGKKVRLEFKGEETEIDKNVADLIADPLVHMIRNSIDHGLEAPAQRLAAGKEETGTVSLEASQEGGEILISVADDGRGMSRARILAKAIERNLVAGDGADLADEDVFQFIFMPGFSTAEAVTSTSGRGVGMDVVKSNLDRIGGRITIRSSEGRGSTIVLRIPLTLSIIDGMLVRVGRSLFTLPLLAIKESISPRAENLARLANGREILVLRGKVLPVVRLHQVHGLAADAVSLVDGLLINLESRGDPYCLFVDELVGQRQTVVKALPKYFGPVPGVSSCSILDNGEISLILDVAGLYERHLEKEGMR